MEAFGAGGRGWRQAVRIAGRLRRLRRRLGEIKPDIVISFLTKINVQVGLAGAGPGVPIILSERNNYRLQELNPLWNLAGRVAASRAARLVMQTEAARRHLPPNVRGKAVVIPNPIDTAAPIVPPSSAGNRIVAAGRLAPQKGFDLLLAAFVEVAHRVPSATSEHLRRRTGTGCARTPGRSSWASPTASACPALHLRPANGSRRPTSSS